MAPLAHTLALLAMVAATTAIEVFPLDMALDSFDDQYQGCGSAMTAALPALNRSEFQKNPLFAGIWRAAVAEWQKRGSRVFPLVSPDHAIALMTYTMGAYGMFNIAVREAGRSPQQYRDNFNYKSLHFLLTQALVTLRDTLEGHCMDVFDQYCGARFEAKRGDSVRFGQFWLMWTSERGGQCPVEMLFRVDTCHGGEIQYYSELEREAVLIPPFETFQVTNVTREGGVTQIQLRSTGTFSKYNCEWLQGGSISMAPFHLGGLLLATTALAEATRIL